MSRRIIWRTLLSRNMFIRVEDAVDLDVQPVWGYFRPALGVPALPSFISIHWMLKWGLLNNAQRHTRGAAGDHDASRSAWASAWAL